MLLLSGNSSFTLLSHSLQEPGQERLRGVGRRRAAEADVRQDEGQPHQETGNLLGNMWGIVGNLLKLLGIVSDREFHTRDI